MAAEETRPRHLELPDYVRIISKRKWFILVVTAVATLVGGLYSLSSERVYEATALVLAQQRPQGFFWVTGEEASMLPNVAMETYARIIRSSEVTSRAAQRLGELPRETRIITTAGEIQSTLDVSVIPPGLLRIDATSPDGRKAQYYANYVARAFVQVNTENRQSESRTAREFLEEQVDEYRQELQDLIGEMAQMARESGYVDVESEVAAAVNDLRNYENRRRELEAELEGSQARLAELQRLKGSESEVTVSSQPQPNPEWGALNDRLTTATIELENLEAQYTSGHPEVLDKKALVQELQQRLEDTPRLVDAPTVRPNPTVENIENEIKAARTSIDEARARLGAFDRVVENLESKIRELPEERQKWRALTDRLEAVRNAYHNLREELRQARLAEAIKQGNARVVDTAEGAREIKASLARSLVFAGALGLFVGLALAILLEALDDTIYSVEDLQRVSDLYLLGVVPLRTDEAGPLVTVDAPKSPPAEAYRTLRSNVRFSLFDTPANTFLVTSAGSGEGKSVTAANLAVAYAQSGDSVIVADTDLRRPILHRVFEVESDMGATNVLVGDAEVEDVLQDTEVPGLRLLPSGPLPPNPAELLESDQMTEMIERLGDLADVVIFDSPPAVMLADAVIMASKLDRTILVAESGQITERAITDVERLFRHARAEVLGIVLNKLRVTGGDYYYYYYYYYYDYSSRPRDRDTAPDRQAPQRPEPPQTPDDATARPEPPEDTGAPDEPDRAPQDPSDFDLEPDEGPQDLSDLNVQNDEPEDTDTP